MLKIQKQYVKNLNMNKIYSFRHYHSHFQKKLGLCL